MQEDKAINYGPNQLEKCNSSLIVSLIYPGLIKKNMENTARKGNSVSMMPEHRMTMTMPCIVSMLIQKKDLSTNMHTRTVAGTYMR